MAASLCERPDKHDQGLFMNYAQIRRKRLLFHHGMMFDFHLPEASVTVIQLVATQSAECIQ